jgi:hypothetical protein
MNLSLELLYGIALVKNKGVITVTAEPLVISLNSRDSLKNLYITAVNGDKTITFEVVDGGATLPEALKTAGTLQMSIRQIINGEVLRTWTVEQIYFKELGGEYEAIPQVTELTEKVAALTDAIAELKNIIIEREEF